MTITPKTVTAANAGWASALINRKIVTVVCPKFPGGSVTFTVQDPSELDRLRAFKNAPTDIDNPITLKAAQIEWLAGLMLAMVVDPDTKAPILNEETSLNIALSGIGSKPLADVVVGAIETGSVDPGDKKKRGRKKQ